MESEHIVLFYGFVVQKYKILHSLPVANVFIGGGLILFEDGDEVSGWVGEMKIVLTNFCLPLH